MDVFELRNGIIGDYSAFARSFLSIRDARISARVDADLQNGALWPDPLVQLNPAYESGGSIPELIREGLLHPETERIFARKPAGAVGDFGRPLQLHRHQRDAIALSRQGKNYVVTTGTGSGKSLTYIIPIVDHVLRTGSGKGIKAIIVYPMNALANSQEGELKKFIQHGYEAGHAPLSFARYTGQESDERKRQICDNPPDILLTNFVMLELLLTRPAERPLVHAASSVEFIVLDELHTYRGRQGSDVALLLRRARELFSAPKVRFVGTSATMSSQGSFEERRAVVAGVASTLFGAPVEPNSVVVESLKRVTDEIDFSQPGPTRQLRDRTERGHVPASFDALKSDSLASWLESAVGVIRADGRLVRALPRAIDGSEGLAAALGAATSASLEDSARSLRELLLAGYDIQNPANGYPAFAFRLHQFISRGDNVMASLEAPGTRHVTLNGQRFVPNTTDHQLLPVVFCRECGQEYYCVSRAIRDGRMHFEPRDLGDRLVGEESDSAQVGFLFESEDQPWPTDPEDALKRLPDDWLTVTKKGGLSLKSHLKKFNPVPICVNPSGDEDQATGRAYHWIPSPFRFCLHCGVTYSGAARSDFGKLTPLGTGGRSSATTILSLSAVRHLRSAVKREDERAKLLSFTDNRQDASLQAGHFNDFVEIGLMRAALYRACVEAPQGIEHEQLSQHVQRSLGLPFDRYAAAPDAKFQQKQDIERAFRDVIGYRVFRDLERGWRLTSPNLEQVGLLRIEYKSIDEVCADQSLWQGTHASLAGANPAMRRELTRVLLDFLRRELAIKVDALTREGQERIWEQSRQRLIQPWGIDEGEARQMVQARYAVPTGKLEGLRNPQQFLFVSPRGGFGQFLRRQLALTGYDNTEVAVAQLFAVLSTAGLIEQVDEVKDNDTTFGVYQLVAATMVWRAGDGRSAFHDPIRVPNPPPAGLRPNQFFIDFYRSIAHEVLEVRAGEHTAQVPSDVRQTREDDFRTARLPVLYCSPTMELGVDIADLSVVNMRNVPPTPANYAQRSGRAGRSGQPALVFTYCATGSPHDQYFFKRPRQMVAGSVAPPRLDLGNEDLVRAHVHSVWLHEAQLDLRASLSELLDLGGENPTLALRPELVEAVRAESTWASARARAVHVLASVNLSDAEWYSEGWLDGVLSSLETSLHAACDRWRGLYQAADAQRRLQDRILNDNTKPSEERHAARKLRDEAERQKELLISRESKTQSDFYTYRYLASEGFLPGYNFPRLPLSAYIPARTITRNADFVSRPRFLAISEFGPRALVYYEGSRYRINRVMLPISDESTRADGPRGGVVSLGSMKQCGHCGYLHPIPSEPGPDVCERCGARLATKLDNMFRLQSVSTKRVDRINSDEEERQRLGYDVRTAFRFAERGGRLSVERAEARIGVEPRVEVSYGAAATMWRMNLGWRRRGPEQGAGFMLDMQRGYWVADKSENEVDADDPVSNVTKRVVPYVEDRKNSLLLAPKTPLSNEQMASLQAALRRAIQVVFQVEENELAAEPLPTPKDRRVLLFYEASEGGAGVLKQLARDTVAWREVMKAALDVCHFDEHGVDLKRAPHSTEDCAGACYDCLMSYGNQPDHDMLSRHSIRDTLVEWLRCEMAPIQLAGPKASSLTPMSEVESRWIAALAVQALRQPTRNKPDLTSASAARPDFSYDDEQVLVYVDGSDPTRSARDKPNESELEESGYRVIRFADEASWSATFARYPSVFGGKNA